MGPDDKVGLAGSVAGRVKERLDLTRSSPSGAVRRDHGREKSGL